MFEMLARMCGGDAPRSRFAHSRERGLAAQAPHIDKTGSNKITEQPTRQAKIELEIGRVYN